MIAAMLLLLAVMGTAHAESARKSVRRGNQLYADGQYAEAINAYNNAEVEEPAAIIPKFNKANSYYRLDDLGEAIDLYQEVAAESKDMALVCRAKYNLGNCFFQRGSKQRDSDLHKALEDMETSITYWRGVLDIDPENARAARNIEVARLTIKDILDQIKKQQEEQKQQQNQQDQQDQQNQDQQQQGQQQQQDPSNSQQDPNQPQDPNQAQQGTDQKQDPNQADQQQQSDQQQQEQEQDQKGGQAEQQVVPDTTAQEILDKEQRQKKQRRILQSRQMQKVEKDW